MIRTSAARACGCRGGRVHALDRLLRAPSAAERPPDAVATATASLLITVRDRLREQHASRRASSSTSSIAAMPLATIVARAPRPDRARAAVRSGASTCADFRRSARRVLRYGSRSSSPRSRASPSASDVAARQPSSDARRARRRATERRTSPRRAGSNVGSDGDAGDLGARAVQLEHGRLDAGADVEDAARRGRPPRAARRRRRRRRRSRGSGARRRRSSSPRRAPCRSRKIDDDAALEARVPAAGRRRSRAAATTCVVPWMRFQPARYSSPQSFAIPYGEQRLARRRLRRRGTVALAVDRAAGRGEDDLRAGARARPRAPAPCRRRSPRRRGRARATEVCTSACAARWKTTSTPATSTPSRMSRSTNVAAGVDVLALAEREVVDDEHLVAARDEARRRGSSR